MNAPLTSVIAGLVQSRPVDFHLQPDFFLPLP